MEISCPICITDTKDFSVCPFCNFECCKSCHKTYALDTIEAKCMKCLNLYSRVVITSIFGPAFINKEYKWKRERDLFESEKVMISKLQSELEMLETHAEEIEKLLKSPTSKHLAKIDGIIKTIINEHYKIFKNQVGPKPLVEKFIKCPNCPGFMKMLNENFHCSICQHVTCRSCREPLNENHVCNQNIVESIRLLDKDTKECPKCGTQIHKIDGCDQMWDPSCQTAFSWKTLEIVRDRIHNPHYYEYMRAHGGMPPEETRMCPDEIPNFIPINDIIDSLHQRLLHNELKWRNDQRRHVFSTEESLLKLRLKYLFRVCSENDFCVHLQRIAKKTDYFEQVFSIHQHSQIIGIGIIQYIYTLFIENKRNFSALQLSKCLEMISSFRNDIQDSLNEISSVFKMKRHVLFSGPSI